MAKYFLILAVLALFTVGGVIAVDQYRAYEEQGTSGTPAAEGVPVVNVIGALQTQNPNLSFQDATEYLKKIEALNKEYGVGVSAVVAEETPQPPDITIMQAYAEKVEIIRKEYHLGVGAAKKDGSKTGSSSATIGVTVAPPPDPKKIIPSIMPTNGAGVASSSPQLVHQTNIPKAPPVPTVSFEGSVVAQTPPLQKVSGEQKAPLAP
jgi:hypothetical protein